VRELSEGKTSFLKKRSKKLFFVRGTGVFAGTGPNEQSFFCFFFVHKKEDSSTSSAE
jgi:hypothetical protein